MAWRDPTHTGAAPVPTRLEGRSRHNGSEAGVVCGDGGGGGGGGGGQAMASGTAFAASAHGMGMNGMQRCRRSSMEAPCQRTSFHLREGGTHER